MIVQQGFSCFQLSAIITTMMPGNYNNFLALAVLTQGGQPKHVLPERHGYQFAARNHE